MNQLEDAQVPALLRSRVGYTSDHSPSEPADLPAFVAEDPAWTATWNRARELRGTWEGGPESWSPKRRIAYAQWLAATGHYEMQLIVNSCAHAASNYDLRPLDRMAILQQAYDDMNHAESFIFRGSAIAGESYWDGVPRPTSQRLTELVVGMARRDLGGFFAAIALHTEAYPAHYTPVEAFMADPVSGSWLNNEIAEEASHLDFLLPMVRRYLNDCDAETAEARQRQLVRDDETLMDGMVLAKRDGAARVLVDELGMPERVMERYDTLNERRRYVYGKIGLEEAYWPSDVRATIPAGAADADD